MNFLKIKRTVIGTYRRAFKHDPVRLLQAYQHANMVNVLLYTKHEGGRWHPVRPYGLFEINQNSIVFLSDNMTLDFNLYYKGYPLTTRGIENYQERLDQLYKMATRTQEIVE